MKIANIDITGLIWADKFEFAQITAETAETLSGNKIVWETEHSGQPITLTGGSDYGWLNYAIISDIAELAKQSNGEFVLTMDDNSTKRVRFRHENSPVIIAQPVLTKALDDDADMYNNISIKLSTI